MYGSIQRMSLSFLQQIRSKIHPKYFSNGLIFLFFLQNTTFCIISSNLLIILLESLNLFKNAAHFAPSIVWDSFYFIIGQSIDNIKCIKPVITNIMIENVILLLVANTLLPMAPFNPVLMLPLPLVQFAIQEPSIFQAMNISRRFTSQQFKIAYKQSMKRVHPDHGGTQEEFSRIRNFKKLMEGPVNYYDTLNVTHLDMGSAQELAAVVRVKVLSYSLQMGIFYLITILYVLAFTIDSELKASRKYLIPLILVFLAYEWHIYNHPQQQTIIDLINPHIPIFRQVTILKRTLAILVAIVRCLFLKKKTVQKTLREDFKKHHTAAEYKDILVGLHNFYVKKCEEKKAYENSFQFKLKNWISKGVSGLIFVIIALSISGILK